MATPTMKRILADTQALIQEKRAEYKTTVAGEKQAKGLDISGAGDDSPKTRGHALEADEAALEPTKKPLDSGDAFVAPDDGGNGTPSQAKNPGGGDDSEMTRGHALEADEPALEPTKKPLNSGEALDVKEATGAAKIANDILTDIRTYQAEQKTAGDAESQPAGKVDVPPAAEATPEDSVTAALKEAGVDAETIAKVAAALKPAAEKSAEEKAAMKMEYACDKCKAEKGAKCTCDDGGKKADAPKKEAEGQEVPAKAAAHGPNLELTTDVLAKIAAHILSTTEGAAFTEEFLAKEAGAEECREILGFLADQSDRAEKEAAFAAGEADATALHEQAIFQAGVASAEKKAAIKAPAAKQAAVTVAPAATEADFYTKLGQAVADQSIQALMGGAPGGDMGGGAVPPEALAGAEAGGGEALPPEAGGEALPPEAVGGEALPPEAGGEMGAEGGGEDVSPEELMGALQELVAEGTISEEEASQVLEYIQAGGQEGGEMGGEALPPEAGGEVAPPAAGGEVAPPAAGAGGEEAVPPAGGGEGDEGLEVEASAGASNAAGLLAAIQAVRQQK